MPYDIIGDIHGHAEALTALLSRLDYKQQDGTWHHPSRQAIFVGDFIDRGPAQREVLRIVRPMIYSGAAQAVMGNHEFNAIAYATRHPQTGEYLRPHTEKNRRQHQAFLDEFASDPAGYADAIKWFRTLPLWLELPGLRIVHACWDAVCLQQIANAAEATCPTSPIDNTLLTTASDPANPLFNAVETILKGREIRLPDGAGFHDKDGNPRQHIRMRWWDARATTYRQAYLGPESARSSIPDEPITEQAGTSYPSDAPPVFIGHYWMHGAPQPLSENIACVDYSVAKPGGKLVAYRWSGEKTLDTTAFVEHE